MVLKRENKRLARELKHLQRSGEFAGIILGLFFIFGGMFLIVNPKGGMVPHPDLGYVGGGVRWVTEGGCRICGVMGIVLGVGIIWMSHWPAWGARRSAIDDYVWNLSQQLLRCCGRKRYYDIEDVSRVARNFDCDMAYIAYAHAMFCSREDFDAYYGPLRVRCTYDGLRKVVARRYLDGAYGFDAGSVVRFATPPNNEEFSFYQGKGPW